MLAGNQNEARLSERAAPAGSVAGYLRHTPAFPRRYVWYVLVGFLDLILTNTLINYFGAIEANGIAAAVIHAAGFGGLVAFKAASMVLVIAICEVIARKRVDVARKLSGWAIGLSAVPVVAGAVQLAAFDPQRHLAPEDLETLAMVGWEGR